MSLVPICLLPLKLVCARASRQARVLLKMAHAAGESVGDDVNKDDSPDYDAKLDFFSAEFDPLKALQAEGLNIPVTGAKIYDNISQYESKCILGRNTQRKPEQKAGTSKEATIERRFEPHQCKLLYCFLIAMQIAHAIRFIRAISFMRLYRKVNVVIYVYLWYNPLGKYKQEGSNNKNITN